MDLMSLTAVELGKKKIQAKEVTVEEAVKGCHCFYKKQKKKR